MTRWKILTISIIALIVGILSLNAFVAYKISHPERRPVSLDPSILGMNYSEITFKSGDIKLKGWFIPGDSNATIVIAHGYGGNKAGCLDYAEFLHKASYNLLLFDFRAHGESEGNWTSNGYYESDDIIAAVNYLKENFSTYAEKIGVLGISMGGKAAIIASAKTEEIDAVVADSAPAGFIESMNLRERVGMKSSKVISLFVIEDLVSYLYELQTGISEDRNKALNYVDRMNSAMLIIHGDKDGIVPVKDAYLLYERAKGPKSIWIVNNTGHHGAHQWHRVEYEGNVIRFFDLHLK